MKFGGSREKALGCDEVEQFWRLSSVEVAASWLNVSNDCWLRMNHLGECDRKDQLRLTGRQVRLYCIFSFPSTRGSVAWVVLDAETLAAQRDE